MSRKYQRHMPRYWQPHPVHLQYLRDLEIAYHVCHRGHAYSCFWQLCGDWVTVFMFVDGVCVRRDHGNSVIDDDEIN